MILLAAMPVADMGGKLREVGSAFPLFELLASADFLRVGFQESLLCFRFEWHGFKKRGPVEAPLGLRLYVERQQSGRTEQSIGSTDDYAELQGRFRSFRGDAKSQSRAIGKLNASGDVADKRGVIAAD